MTREQEYALANILSCFCDTWRPDLVSQWCEERGMTEEDLENDVRKLQDIAGLCLL